MNERVKEIRKALGLSGEKFGSRIGLTRMAISNIENNKYNLTEQSILSICREFNVNEEWLRTGTGEMFISAGDIPLAEMIEQNQVSQLELKALRAYFSLDKETRQQIVQRFQEVFQE